MGFRILKFFVAISLLATAGYAVSGHAWSNYHWARTTTSFELTILNSTTPDWDPYVTQAVGDWSQSSKMNMAEVDSATGKKDRRQCKSPAGQVRICNLEYGQTGWLGIAGISLDSQGHISTGYTKLNDTYFDQASYNAPDWKQSVTCQELGHNVGLGHQDETFNNASLFSCMDYQDPPYEYPNAHDFDQLDVIYGHTDDYNSTATDGGGGGGGGCNSPPGKGCNKGATNNRDIGWGMSMGRRGQHETFMRIDPDGTRHLTHVTWAVGH